MTNWFAKNPSNLQQRHARILAGLSQNELKAIRAHITRLFHCADRALQPSERGLLKMQLQPEENIYA